MLHAGLDLSRKRLDVCLLSEHGELVEEFSAPPDADGLRGLVRHVERHGVPVRGVIESMTGARFVHDTLEQLGWETRSRRLHGGGYARAPDAKQASDSPLSRTAARGPAYPT